jgi:mono/diheme cytochrome c family protein
MRPAWLVLAVAALLEGPLGLAQSPEEVTKQGEQVFNRSCATGYCHGLQGIAAGAPRLAARGFDQAYIDNTVARGLQGTSMPAFTGSLSRSDLNAVCLRSKAQWNRLFTRRFNGKQRRNWSAT